MDLQLLPLKERPRERLLQHGSDKLSAPELLAIILGSGTKAAPVLKLANELIAHFGTLGRLSEATIEELCQIKGIGQAKAIQLKACFQLGLRAVNRDIKQKIKIDSPQQAYQLVKDDLETKEREIFMVILKDAKNYLITYQIVAIGSLSELLVHPREVFYPAIRHKAASLILAHNHPTGDPTPSQEDIAMTKTLIEAGHLMGIPIHDHLIVGFQQFISLRPFLIS